ncbi:30S ribosomal protein S14 [Natronobacterium gregoryi]|uniref:Small ribosomal subunit protein uS14 n=2 Tax=Natronobacterium gregoryi TaxID=44930 RepID=L0AJE6_NATGS|nr:30S ribosomal protein S14 [Natronobacterium gregoryi]AFZ73297.1 ribosomal protein S14 [Natronobacterium gregoryi SP2]ELY73941.1 30S ribosomal protein S14 [Natronobacterium gregoryi SP2]PLK19907.1 30S ribosomal protein S14 [Natronobacterium gregoryi SP2]SFJ38003.1 small subunit ribosomal protein S14 [Natronobacterium gregoryi]
MDRSESSANEGTTTTTDSDNATADGDDERTGQTRVCRDTGRKQGLIGKYDIWLCRQSFREMAHDMGFRKYD